jgi:hypothetical protein
MSLWQDDDVLAGGSASSRLRSHRHTIRKYGGVAAAATLGLAVLASAVDAGAASATTAQRQTASSRLVTVLAAPKLLSGDRAVGAVSSTSVVRGAIALKPRSQSAIKAFIAEVSNPRSPMYHEYLSKGEYANRFGPTKAAVAAVRAQLRRDGLHVGTISANRLFVSFSGSAARVETAFGTGLERVHLATGGLGQATTSAVRLPEAVGRFVQGVVGLDNLVHETSGAVFMHGHHTAVPGTKLPRTGSGGPVACPTALALQAEGALTDQQVAYSYGLDPLYNAGDLGQGQTVDIYELEPFSMSDVAAFDKCYFGKSHTSQVSVTTVDGGPGTGLGSGEAALDVDDVSAIAPGADIHVFSGPNMNDNFGPLDTWNAIAMADDARQISTSWGLCESDLQQGAPGVQQIENNIFEQTAAQGQSVFSAAGDDGSDDCSGHADTPIPADLSVDDPASQPFVTAVGGTTITNATFPPAETVWNNGTGLGGFGGAAGGGVSNTWGQEPWQAGVYSQTAGIEACSNDPSGAADNYHLAGEATTLPSGTPCRLLPDVSALADPQTGITIEYGGQMFPIGGTSSSTPLWAAMTAEMNNSSFCSTAGATGLGFISPLLYAVGTGAHASSAFNDITVGNNDNLSVGNGTQWTAGKGFDLASGLGTPQVTNSNNEGLANQLCSLVSSSSTALPVVSSVTRNFGTLAGGTAVVIDGSNFGANQGTVYFGQAAGTVTAWTPDTIHVTSPKFFPGNSSPANEGGSVVVTVTTSGTPHASSSPSANSVFHYTGGSTTTNTPIIDYVSSPAGTTAGGNTVQIVGSGFEEDGGATGVTFGGVKATSYKVVNDNEITAVPPAQSSSTACETSMAGICQVEVVVTNAAGSSATEKPLPAYTGPVVFQASGIFAPPAGCGCEVIQQPDEYDYAPAPTITNANTQYASETGGTTLALSGSGFNILDLYWVNVGPSAENTSQDFGLAAITPTTLDFVAPPDPNFAGSPTVEPDATEVSVQTSGGLSNTYSDVAFAGVPVVTGLSRHLGAQGGGTSLTITGEGFTDANLIAFIGGGGALGSTQPFFTINSDTSITLRTPAFYNTSTDVLVCSVTGCSTPNPAVDGFTFAYPGQPVVNSSSPSSGGEQGGTLVTIEGALDTEVTAVHFGKRLGTIVQQGQFTASAPILVAAPPSTSTGTVDITITTLGGELVGHPRSAVNPKATFTYTKSAPSAPRGLTAKAGKLSISASWKVPYTDGGFRVTGYVVKATAKHHRTVTVKTTATKATVRGLAKGVGYTITVVAVNKKGDGLPATAGPIKPS